MRGTWWLSVLSAVVIAGACGGSEPRRDATVVHTPEAVRPRDTPLPRGTGPLPEALRPLADAIASVDDARPETIATVGRLLAELEDAERAAARREIAARGVVTMRLAPGGTKLVTSDGRRAAVWDLATGQPIATAAEGDTPEDARAAIAADGSAIAEVAGGRARVLDVQSAREIGVVQRLPAGIDEIAVAPGGARLVVVATRGGRTEASLYDVAGGRRIGRPIAVKSGEVTWAPLESDVMRVGFAGGGTHLLTLAPSGEDVEVWATQDGRRAGSLFGEGHDPSARVSPRGSAHVWIAASRSRIVALADASVTRALPDDTTDVAADGTRAVARSAEGRGMVHPLEPAGAAVPLAPAGDRSGIGPGRFFDRGRKLWALVGPATIGVFDAASGRVLGEVAGREAFGSPDQPHLWAADGAFANIWREGAEGTRLWVGADAPVEVVWRADGTAIARDTGRLTVWDPARASRDVAPGYGMAGVGRVSWSGDGRRVFARIGDPARLRGLDRSYGRREPDSASPVVIDRATRRRISDPREHVVFVPRPEPARVSEGVTLQYRDQRTGEIVDRLAYSGPRTDEPQAWTGPARRAEIRFDGSPQRAIAVIGGWHAHRAGGGARGDAGRLSLLDARTGRELAPLVDQGIGASAISADGSTVVAVVGTTLTSWGGRDGRQLGTPALAPPAPGGELHLSPDGSRAVVGGWDGAGLYDVRTGREVAHVWTAEPPVEVPGLEPLGGLRSKDVAFTPNGTRMVTSASPSGIWDVVRGARIAEVPGVVVAARTDLAQSWIASWHQQRLSRWEVATGRRVWTVDLPADVTVLRFAHDTGDVLVGGADGTIRVLAGADGREAARWSAGATPRDGSISADGAWIAIVVDPGLDGEVRRARDGALAGTFHVAAGVSAMSISPDGTEIAVAAPDGIRFFPIGAAGVASLACRAAHDRAPQARLPERCY